MSLVSIPLTSFQRDRGLLIHLRRSDAPAEPKAKRCVDCKELLNSVSPRTIRCKTCSREASRLAHAKNNRRPS